MADERTLQENLDLIQQKARERTVKTQTVEYDLETLAKRIDRKSIKLDPDYQRRHRWSRETSSRLIESLILNIPIPVVFISQDVDVDAEVTEDSSRYTVIDGQQRLTAIHDFLRNKFPLEGLETLSELNGAYYKSLPSFLVRRLEERTVKCMRIDSTVDAQIKFDIFERLNTGSVKLEAQELRNATARGPFNELIKELAQAPYFRSLIQVDLHRPEDSPKVQKMEDAELVLRFFALSHGRYRGLRKGFKEFLTASQEEFNDVPSAILLDWKNEFETYMKFLHEKVGSTAFAKWRLGNNGEKRMSSFNAAVFDAVAIGLTEVYTPAEIQAGGDAIALKVGQIRTLFGDADFFASVSGSVNDAAKVTHRINAVAALLRR
ncbi:DUF262 domain-containing protein [Brevundimonas sp. TWP2-3-4b1]|uniref:DUF262 domain-containing protein n=1 Tax=Brevundimonas sp. TWP2-3-4b1 TaxID=2804580 RepID=UPI003CECE4CD